MRFALALGIPAFSFILSAGIPAAFDVTLSVAQAQQDFDLLRSSIEESHGGLYRYSTKAELQQQFDAMRKRIVAPMTSRAYRAFIAEFVALTRDGHARIEFDAATMTQANTSQLFPLRVSIEAERLVVISNDTPTDSTIRPGMDIISINGRSAKALIDQLMMLTPGDGFIETGKRSRLGRTFANAYWMYVDSASQFSIRARTIGGREVSANLRGVSTAERAQNNNMVNVAMRTATTKLEGPTGNFTLTFRGDTAAQLRIRSFDSESFRQDADAAFKSIRDQKSKTLILDLRGNGGGVDLYGAYLVENLANKPFRYFDRIHLSTVKPSFATWKPSTFDETRDGTVADPNGGFLVKPSLHPGVSERVPVSNPFTGKLIVLIDGGSFSTTADVTAVLHTMKRATFIGEETGGGYEGNTSGLNAEIKLPNSGIRLKIMMYEYYNAVTTSTHGRGTMPDVEVKRTTDDVLKGVDPQLNRALNMAVNGSSIRQGAVRRHGVPHHIINARNDLRKSVCMIA